MVEATKNKNQILLLVPRSFEGDEQGWAAKFSTEQNPVKMVTSKKACNNFVGIVVYALAADKEGSDECAELLKGSYKNVPATVNMADAESFNTTELVGKIAEASENIKKVFESFDKDNSGFIDRDELKQAIAQIGVEMNEMDVYNMMIDLDRNKDGKISLDEFQSWWLTGRKGVTGTMSKLMEAATRKAGGKFADLPNFATLVGDVPAVTTKTNYAELGFNKSKMMGKEDNAISSFYAKACVGPHAREHGTALMNSQNPGQANEDPTNGYAQVTLKMKQGYSDASFGEGGFIAFFDKIKGMLPVPATCTFADGNYIFGACAPGPPVIPDFVEELISKIPHDQCAEFQFQMGATPKEILAGLGGGNNPLAFALQGIAIRKNVEVWDGFVQTMVKMMTPEEGEEPNPMLMQILMPMLPAYLMQFRGTLDIDVDMEAVEEIWQTVKQMGPMQLQEFFDGSNSAARDVLMNAKEGPGAPSILVGKTNVEMIQLEDGPWSLFVGHKDVTSEEDAIKLYSASIEAEMNGGACPTHITGETRKHKKMWMATLVHLISMIFGDEVRFEAFACPQDMGHEDLAEAGISWAKSGIPVSVKGALRMEGASEIIRLLFCNGIKMI